VRDSLVGPRKTIPRFVDLALGETLDHEQVPYGIVRLVQFAVGRDERATIDHEVSLLTPLAGSSQDRELVSVSPTLVDDDPSLERLLDPSSSVQLRRSRPRSWTCDRREGGWRSGTAGRFGGRRECPPISSGLEALKTAATFRHSWIS